MDPRKPNKGDETHPSGTLLIVQVRAVNVVTRLSQLGLTVDTLNGSGLGMAVSGWPKVATTTLDAALCTLSSALRLFQVGLTVPGRPQAPLIG
jgi:hypothetical protein